jgi:hypothetical protein
VIGVDQYECLPIVANFLETHCDAIKQRDHRVFLWSIHLGMYGSLVPLVSSYRDNTHVTLIVPWVDTALNGFYNVCKDVIEKIGVDFVVCPCQNENEEINSVHWMHIKSALIRIISEKYRIIVFCGRTITSTAIQRDVRMLLSGPPRPKKEKTVSHDKACHTTRCESATAANVGWGDHAQEQEGPE